MCDNQQVKYATYNPFEHRNVEKPNSDIRSLANLVKSSLGAGILALPLAFSNSGWAVGIIGTIFIGFVCYHCVHIFVETSQGCCRLERTPLLGYADTCKAAFANGPKPVRKFASAAWYFSDCSMLFTYIGTCCVYTLLIADSIKQILDTYCPVIELSVQYYCLILLVPICLICQIRHLKYLAPFSMISNILLMATFAICLYYIFGGAISFTDKRVIGNPARFPAFLSTVIFAMEGIGVVMPVENNMKKPQHFLSCPGVLVIAMTVVTLLYTTLGLFGYFRYGDVLRGTITLNLPIDQWPAICAKCFIASSLFFSMPLPFFVVMDIFNRFSKSCIKVNSNGIQIVTRAIMVCLCVGITIVLPMLEQIISLVGALFFSILGLIIPGLVHTIFRWEDLGRFNWILWKNVVIILIGLFALVSGCTVAILDIIHIINNKTV